MRHGRLALVGAALGMVACVGALKPPPALSDLVGPVPARVEPDAWLAEAERFGSSESVEEVRRASELWLKASVARPGDVEPLASAARARVWLSDRGVDEAARRQDAVAAVQIAQHCVALEPENPRCRYALALALGVQARERRSTALDALPTIVELLESLTRSDPALDRGGPHRVLALVLLRAPGWPTGPGDPDEGLLQAREAVRLGPNHPPNLLALAEALEQVEGGEAARPVYREARDRSAAGRDRGERDAGQWQRQATLALERLNTSGRGR